MDTLSTLLENVHLYETNYYRIRAFGQWSYTIVKKDVISFYLVESGGFCIELDGVSRKLSAGDMIMIPNSVQHVCYSLGHHANEPVNISDKLMQADESIIVLNSHLLGLNSRHDVVKSEMARISTSVSYQGLTDATKAAKPPSANLVLIECQYDKELTRPLLKALPTLLPDLEVASQSRFKIIESSCQFLSLESAQKRMGQTAMINHLASILMIECLRTHIESLPEATESWLRAIKDPYLSKALTVMHDAPDENWTIHRLAEVAGMSRSSFAERFKEVVGVPPLTYLIDYRLRLAARYLRLQQNSISRISELVGYASDSTFSQAFKRVYGMSPRAYRQQYQQR